MAQKGSKACRDLSDSLLTLYLFVLSHVVIAKPLHTFARHALVAKATAPIDALSLTSAR
jgi:hypothetical protein